jgi:cellulose synthase (UDP-forming)
VFAIWWFNVGHIPDNFDGVWSFLDILLFLMVSYVVWHPIVMRIFTWGVASNIKDLHHLKPASGYRVAFITNFVPQSESIELLERNLPAMLRATYAHDTWVLDEGDDPRVRALCKKLGVKHFSRKDMPHYNTPEGKYKAKTKGGNHNSWYDTIGHTYDFVAQIDTDFVPRKDFLVKTLGYFKDEKVAFVGTPQVYGNMDGSIIARGAAEQTYSFYGPLLRGFFGMGMTMLIGANHVIRTKALKDIDYYTAHITEDLLTGMELHAKGWKSVYVHEALAIGEGPDTWAAYFSQQMRWAYGCMHILFRHSPKLFYKMTWRQKIYYFVLQQHYFSGLAMVFGVVGLASYFVFNVRFADIDVRNFLLFYIPTLFVLGVMALYLQRFNVRPTMERGVMWAGRVIGIASWPIFFMAFLGLVRGKRMSYKVTPKGQIKDPTPDNHQRHFRVHFILGMITLISVVYGASIDRLAPLMVFWATVSSVTLLCVPHALGMHDLILGIRRRTAEYFYAINEHYKIFEISAPPKLNLPSAPDDIEKYSYTKRAHRLVLSVTLVSFVGASLSMYRFLSDNLILWPVYFYFGLTLVYFVVSYSVNIFTKDFDLDAHMKLVKKWLPKKHPSVDIFLPTAGEPIEVLENTWIGVHKLRETYTGDVNVYCLDDSARELVEQLARDFDFKYLVRPNRGEFKKAGNLRYGFNNSSGDYIVIFDADFVPRGDFLNELLPYMENDKTIGIVQSPQYFDTHARQNWLERGAGAVQEFFYRYGQVSRNNHGASICVGSNAVYRREALLSTGGTALIEHSEDVHTGFNLYMKGWSVCYVPIILAKGLCPDGLSAFFKQQYRWCLGSMSMLSSEKFWKTKLKLRARLSYFSGFLYYIHTGISSFFVPAVPLYLLLFAPDKIRVEYILFLIPSILYMHVFNPLWHNVVYGIEAWAVRSVYGWAHFFAIRDAIQGRTMSWQPTGSKITRDVRFDMYRVLQIVFNFVPATVWVIAATYRLADTGDILRFSFILFSGFYYFAIVSKVTFYTQNVIRPNLGLVRSTGKSTV